jgi:hypothetical protein
MTSPLMHHPAPNHLSAPRPRSTSGGGGVADGSGNARRAWVAVVLMPVAFVVAMAVGEGLISALGYESGAEVPVPLAVALAVGVPVTLAAMIPPALAVLFGRRARLEGHRSALLAIAFGGAALLFWIATFLLALVDRAIN